MEKPENSNLYSPFFIKTNKNMPSAKTKTCKFQNIFHPQKYMPVR